MTSVLSPPRNGSGKIETGRRTQSESLPTAWLVLEPSKPQIGGSSPSASTLVFDRSYCVGSAPSIQMYSARYAISTSHQAAVRTRGDLYHNCKRYLRQRTFHQCFGPLLA